MKYVDPPFELGETLDGTDADGNLINDEVLGKVFEFPLSDTGANSIRGGKTRLTGKTVVAVALRNTSGAALLGKRVGKCDETAGYTMIETCAGYADTLADDNIVIIDDKLPSAGVADDDIFWGIISGPVEVLVPTTGAAMNGDISVGNWLVAATASTSGNSTSGRVSNVTLPGQTGATDAFNMAANAVGRALSARTTQETTDGTGVLINACIRL